MEEKGTWLLITNPVGNTLGYVRLDDHDHDLDLSEIREMISSKLISQPEYAHGWSFGTGWPLRIVGSNQERNVLAKTVLPAISVLSSHSAQHLSQKADPISAATAMQYGISAASANANMDTAFSSNVNLNMNMGFPQSGGTGAIQPLPISAMFTPVNAMHSGGMHSVPQHNGNLLPPLSGESRKSGSSQAPPMPTFSPPVLSQQQIAQKAQAQRKKLLNLLPSSHTRWSPSSSALAAALGPNAVQKHTASPKMAGTAKRAKKPMIPRLKKMDSAGNVLKCVTSTSNTKGPVKEPNFDMQRDLYCPQCQKTFPEERGYRTHMSKQHNVKLSRGRNKVRRFECEHHGCDRAFYQRSDLRRHQRVHLGVKPFKCMVCFKEFTQRGSLYRHIKGSHKGQDHTKLVLLQTAQTMPTQTKRRSGSQSVSPTNAVQSVEQSMSDLPPPLMGQHEVGAFGEDGIPPMMEAVPPMVDSVQSTNGNEEGKAIDRKSVV